MELLLYCPEPAEGSLLAGLLIGTAAKLREPLQIQICNTRCGFLEQGKTGTGRILLFAVRGPKSVTLASETGRCGLEIWTSPCSRTIWRRPISACCLSGRDRCWTH